MSTLTKIIGRWGLFKGLHFYYKVKKVKPALWPLPELKHPVHLRPGTSDHAIFKQVFGMGEYDVSLPFVPRTILDGGGNIGLFSIRMTHRFPEADILSIEPDSGNYAQLCLNTGPYPNVHTIQGGIWHQNCKLKVIDEGHDEWGLRVQECAAADTEGLQAYTITDLMAEAGWDTIDVVKLDVEGAEAAIFSGNYEQWLSKTRLLIIELHERALPGSSAAFEKAIQGRYKKRMKYGEYEVLVLQ